MELFFAVSVRKSIPTFFFPSLQMTHNDFEGIDFRATKVAFGSRRERIFASLQTSYIGAFGTAMVPLRLISKPACRSCYIRFPRTRS